MQKFEVYDQGKLKGIVKFNKQLLVKILSVSLSTVISISTLSGCSFSKKGNYIEENHSVQSYTSLEDEIFFKEYFVNNVLETLNEDIKNTNNLFSKKTKEKIMQDFHMVKSLEYEIDLINEYAIFKTEEEIESIKEQILKYLDNAIDIIEDTTEYRLGRDFAVSAKTK